LKTSSLTLFSWCF